MTPVSHSPSSIIATTRNLRPLKLKPKPTTFRESINNSKFTIRSIIGNCEDFYQSKKNWRNQLDEFQTRNINQMIREQ